jgi:transposase InsO family protein
MEQIPPHRRPHYPPAERLAIPQLRAARGWSQMQTAARFLVSALTIAHWNQRLDEEGADALVQVPVPVNTFPEFVSYNVRRLKILCPSMGKARMVNILCRAGLHHGSTTVRRMLKETDIPKRPKPAPSTAPGRVVTARRPNETWHADLTTVPTAFGYWVPWPPGSLPPIWPFCWFVAVVIDHFSRRVMGVAIFKKEPKSKEIRAFLGRAIASAGRAPKHLITDQGIQFTAKGFKAWCSRLGIGHRLGAVGRYGSIAIIERLMRTLKSECTRRLVLVPLRRAAFVTELALWRNWYNADRPHVADFGLAIHETQQALRKGEVFGTPASMAPEQVRGESHRLDGRTDIWAIGVMLYELLTARRPFSSKDRNELYDEILSHDPKPPRQIDRNVPRELERVCLKCLSKRRSDRYNTTDDLRDDLLDWLDTEASTQMPQSTATTAVETKPDSSSSPPPPKIVPKGLRSFDAEDADFFLELLPGPRDRDGLPESIRFWKNRIEEVDPDKTFSVGLIYGPSGCGKSSLVKAGLLPRLSDRVLPIYVEASAEDTEVHILKHLRKHIPRLPADVALSDACAELRRTGTGRDRKVLLVIDQFEQWLHANPDLKHSQLADALRQCEEGRLQAVLLVRDDFYLSVNRVFQELEIRLLEGQNQGLVDLFDADHARKVLTAFGRAYGKLGDELNDEQQQFVERAVKDLAEDQKVISVRLALLADMMKTRPWVPASLHEVGGIGGVGMMFLEETFAAKSAPPAHRVHEQAIRGVLKSLLPPTGTDIKGGRQSIEQLCDAAGYQGTPEQFQAIIQILDSEVRLITPTDPEGTEIKGEVDTQRKHYQLTHDYLVPPLREWLTRKQKETRRGRAELRLAERSAAWNANPDNRHLPAWWEYMSIAFLVPRKDRTAPQKKLMRSATRYYGVRGGAGLTLLFLAALAIQHFVFLERQKSVRTILGTLQISHGPAVPFVIRDLNRLPTSLVQEELKKKLGADYLVDPQVIVQVKEHAKRKVNVTGEVNKPGQVDMPDEKPLTILDAIAMAGGTTRLANESNVEVIRDGQDSPIKFNLKKLRKNPNLNKQFTLESGDSISVPQSRF